MTSTPPGAALATTAGAPAPASAPARVAAQRDSRRVGAVQARVAAVVGLLAAAALLAAFLPTLRLALYAPDLRIVIEVVGLCVALFAAFALAIPATDGHPNAAAHAFVAAIVTLAASNAVFGAGPLLLSADWTGGGSLTFYPWLVARYVAGLLFIAASLQPRMRLTAYVVVALVAVAVIDAVVVLLGSGWPVPLPLVDVAAGGGVDVSTPLSNVLVTALPGVLFGVGAWLAWRVYAERRLPIYAWLSLALWIQVLTQFLEVLEPAVLGPVIRTPDLLRLTVTVALGIGALLQVREHLQDRRNAVERQAEDLAAQSRLLGDMHEFMEREETFRALVVHELATPIATLRGYAQLLASGRISDTDAKAALEGIQSESRRLQQLTRRMEELRTLELQEFRCDLRPVLLRPLLADAALFVRGLPGSHPAEVICDDRVRVSADPVRLGQALRNLLANAARYSPPRTLVTILGRARGDGAVEVSVVDEGPGVAPEERDRVLRKYERGEAGRGEEGAGLGLYIAARIAQAHGGRLFFADSGADGAGGGARGGDRAGAGARAVLELREAR